MVVKKFDIKFKDDFENFIKEYDKNFQFIRKSIGDICTVCEFKLNLPDNEINDFKENMIKKFENIISKIIEIN